MIRQIWLNFSWDTISVLILVAGASIFIESVEIKEQRNWSMAIGLVLIAFMIVNVHNSLREFMGELLNGNLICKKENLNNLTVEDTKYLATYFMFRRGKVRVPFKTAQSQLSPLTFGKLTNNPIVASATAPSGTSDYRDFQQTLSLRGNRTIKMDITPVASKGQTTAAMTWISWSGFQWMFYLSYSTDGFQMLKTWAMEIWPFYTCW
jgi:hypothetical protein